MSLTSIEGGAGKRSAPARGAVGKRWPMLDSARTAGRLLRTLAIGRAAHAENSPASRRLQDGLARSRIMHANAHTTMHAALA